MVSEVINSYGKQGREIALVMLEECVHIAEHGTQLRDPRRDKFRRPG
jgi:hypothetical protein